MTVSLASGYLKVIIKKQRTQSRALFFFAITFHYIFQAHTKKQIAIFITICLSVERKTGLKPATLSLEG